MASYSESQSSSSEKTTSIKQIVKEIENKEVTDYHPVDPNVAHYPSAAKLLESLPQQQLDEKVDLNNIPEEVKDIMYYIRTRYEIVSSSSVIKVTKESSSTSTKQTYKVYFFAAPEENHPAYRVYEAEVNYESISSVSENRINVQSFRLIIDENQLIQNPV